MTDKNILNSFDDFSWSKDIIDMKSNINTFIDWCKEKIRNNIWEDIVVNQRINTVLKQYDISKITYENFTTNYLDYLLWIIRLDFFNDIELKFLMHFIIDELIKIKLKQKKSEK